MPAVVYNSLTLALINGRNSDSRWWLCFTRMWSYSRNMLFGSVVTITSIFILVWTGSDMMTSLIFIPGNYSNTLHFQSLLNHTGNAVDYFSTPAIGQGGGISSADPVDDEGLFHHITDLTSLSARFIPLTLDSCNNTLCEAPHVHCEARTIEEWLEIFNKFKLKSVPLFYENEYFFPWERDYLKTPPLKDINNLPSLNLSKVYLRYSENGRRTTQTRISPNVRNEIVIIKNSAAIFRLDLVDGYGSPRGAGGDEVRAWLKGKTDGPSRQVMWATTRVEDLKNGSYDIIVTPTWTGIAQLKVAVSYPREYIRTTIHHFRIGVHRFIFGKFKKGNNTEVTLCHSSPNIPGRQCICNMTHINDNMPYYCGRPLNPNLSCHDWVEVNTVRSPGYMDMTAAETLMDKEISRPPDKSTISQEISLYIEDGFNKDAPLPPCLISSRRTSWTKTSPRGAWPGGKTRWNSYVCQEPLMSSEWIHECLRSTNVWMIGDSNIRYMAIYLSKTIGCLDHDLNNWPSSSLCRNNEFNITVQFRPHEYPLFVAQRWLSLLDNGPVLDTLASIPSTGEHIVVIHYFLHFSSAHLHVLQQRLTTIKHAIIKLLSRNPRVLVVVRGPHTSALEWQRNHMFAGDVLGPYIRQIHIDVFQDLQDNVVFLDGWDMSISFENQYFHPYETFIKALWRTTLAYKCN